MNYNFYKGKIILAPMVRAGRTPLRLLALQYGADLVYTEEIVDQKLLASKRVVNDVLNTIDYVAEDGVILRVAREREDRRCVLQIGTCSAENAVEICTKIGNDVGAIDINMGCPKHFSIVGGMGAALLTNPERVKEILSSLVQVSTIPISCKIRVLDDRKDTLELVKLIERCGVSAIAVHGRRKGERPSHANRIDEIHEVARAVSVPVIVNGASSEIRHYDDIERIRIECAASSVMIARKALKNPSIFQSSGSNSMEEDIQNFLKLACEFDESFCSTKYVLQRILGGEQEFDPRGRAVVASRDVQDMCKAWSLENVYESYLAKRASQGTFSMDIKTNTAYLNTTFHPKKLKFLSGSMTPKSILNTWSDEAGISRPKYHYVRVIGDKRFQAIIEVDGQKFLSTVTQPNKRMAEQVAALAALKGMKRTEMLVTKHWQ